MSPRRVLRAVALSVLTVLLVTVPQAASAQVQDVPPTYDELGASTPWTYLMAKALLGGAVLLVIAIAIGYAVKSREFRNNQRRGGAK